MLIIEISVFITPSRPQDGYMGAIYEAKYASLATNPRKFLRLLHHLGKRGGESDILLHDAYKEIHKLVHTTRQRRFLDVATIPNIPVSGSPSKEAKSYACLQYINTLTYNL